MANANADDQFHRAMAVRKKRSKQFLENPLCIFTMLNTLVFHHYLSRVTAAAFELHNSDKEGIPLKPSKLQEAKQRKRLLFKGAQVLEEPQDSAEEHASLLKMYGRAHEVVKLLWTVLSSLDAIERTAFCVPMAYWPENTSKADMFQRLSLDILKGIAALKFRILEKSVMPPYSLLEIARPGASPELLSAKTREFLSTPQCCLDACWAKPVQQKVLSEADQPRTLHMHAARFSTSCRGVSSREEALHAQQRKHARGWEGAPILFVRQAAESVLQTAWDNFSVRTGIQEKGAPEKVKAASKIVRKRVIKHARPRQLGSPYFFFRNAAKKSSTETNEQIHRRWNTLSPEELQHWKMRHRLHSGRNKWMKAELAKKKEAEEEARKSVSAPWGLGDDRFPLKESYLRDFLQPYQRKHTGLRELHTLEKPTPEVSSILQETKQYHSMDTANVAARAFLHPSEVTAHSDTWAKVAELPRPRKACPELHPGLCKEVDAAILPKVNGFWQSLPKHDCILMLVRSGSARQRIAVFAQLVVGQGCVSSKMVEMKPHSNC